MDRDTARTFIAEEIARLRSRADALGAEAARLYAAERRNETRMKLDEAKRLFDSATAYETVALRVIASARYDNDPAIVRALESAKRIAQGRVLFRPAGLLLRGEVASW